MKILVLLGFITFALAEKQSNQLDCSIKGPEFWCKSYTTARKCHAVTYCEEYIWSKEKVVSPDADTCTYCQEFVGTIHMMLMNNETQAEVIAGMEAACNLLPDTTKTICTEMVAAYGKQIVADILQYTKDPRKLCTMIHLCTSNSKQVVLDKFLMMKKAIVNKVFADYCIPCKEYISGFHSITSSKKTKSDLVEAMKKMCQFLPIGISTLCPAMVNAKGKQIVDSVIGYASDPSRFCASVGLCKNRDTHPLVMQIPELESIKPAEKSDYIRFSPEKSPDADTCTYCQQFVGTIHMMLMNNETQAEVIAGMEAACNLLPATTKTICTEMVAAYGKQIVADILQYTKDPRKLCTMLHLCKANSNRAVFDNLLMMKKVIVDKVFTDYCMPCKEYISGLHSITSSKKTKSDLVRAMKKMCQFLPKGVSTLCPAMVNAKGKQIVDSVIGYASDPSRFCASVGLCKNGDGHSLVAQIPQGESSKPAAKSKVIWKHAVKEKDGPSCELCVFAMGMLQSMLKSNKTEAAIKAKLHQLCSELPETLQASCKTLVDKYEDEIVHLIIDETEPQVICHELGLCTSSKKAVAEYLVSHLGITCAMCNYVVQVAYLSLADKPTQARIKAALIKLCNEIPSKQIQDECTAVIRNDYDEFLNIILKELKKPKLLCKLANCSSATNAFYPRNGVICETCIQGLTYVETLLQSKRTRDIFKIAVDHACNMLPSALQPECKALATKYADIAFNFLIDQLKNPEKVCKEMHLCTSSQVVKVKKLAINSVIECEICQYAAESLSIIVINNKAKVKSIMLDICSRLPTSLAGQCSTLIDKYFKVLIGIITEKLKNPAEFCKELHMCSSSGKTLLQSIPMIFPKIGPLCEACQIGTHYFAAFLKDNATKRIIKKPVLSLCTFVPSSIEEKCTELVNQYFEVAYKAFVDNLMKNPLDLCKEIHVCASSAKESTVMMSPISPKAGPLCEICEMGAQYAATFLNKNGTEAKIKSSILKLCGELPESIAAQCKTMVGEYFDYAYKMILEQLENPLALCQDMQLCTSSVKEMLKPVKPNNIITCEVCELLIQKLDSMLNGSRIKEDVKNALDNLCKDLPYTSQCTALVNKYSDRIIDLLVVQLKHPELICTELQLCASAVKVTVERMESKNIFTCEICEATMLELKKILDKSHNRKLVIKALDKVCARLPLHLNTECTNLVNYYAPQLIRFIVDQLKDPENFCKELHLCTDQLKKLVSVSEVGRRPQKNGFVTCELCLLGMNYLIEKIKGEISEAAIKKALDALCDELPSGKEQCEHLVNKYSEEIINMILGGILDANTICKKLRICDSTLKAITHQDEQRTKMVEVDPASCKLCMFMSGKLDVQLKKNDSKKVIKKTIKSVCSNSRLSKDNLEECRRMMDEYKDLIIKLVKKVKLPSFCKNIGHCVSRPAEVNAVMPKFVQALRKPNYGGTSCLVCEYAIGVLDTFLSTQSAKDHIIAEIHNLCKKLPRQIFVTECNALITQYGDEMIELFVDGVLAPVDVCQHLHLC